MNWKLRAQKLEARATLHVVKMTLAERDCRTASVFAFVMARPILGYRSRRDRRFIDKVPARTRSFEIPHFPNQSSFRSMV
jgi:hypothetical protein